MRPKRGNERIKGTDSVQDAVIKMAEGNPGALTVMGQLFQKLGDAAIFVVCRFDDMGLYGSDIWIAYKDVCGQDLDKLDRMAHDDQEKLIRAVRTAGGLRGTGRQPRGLFI